MKVRVSCDRRYLKKQYHEVNPSIDWEGMGIERPKDDPEEWETKAVYCMFDTDDVASATETRDGKQTVVEFRNGEREVLNCSHSDYCSLEPVVDFEKFSKAIHGTSIQTQDTKQQAVRDLNKKIIKRTL